MTPLSIMLLNIAIMASCDAVDDDYIPGPIMPPETPEEIVPPITGPQEGEMYDQYGLLQSG